MRTIITLLILVLSLNVSAQKHPKVVSETIAKKNLLNRKTHPNSELVNFKFADGISGQLVKRGDTWYNYNVRGEAKEKPFDSKEAGLQQIWENVKNAEKVGAALASTVIKGKGGKSEKGVLRDAKGAYKMVNGKKTYISTTEKSKFFSN